MTLDLEVAAYLKDLAEAGAPPIEALSVEEARQQMEAGTAALGPTEDVAQVEDRLIPEGARKIPVRIYRPANAGETAVIYFHGGGWVIGSVNTHDGYCRMLANAAQVTVVSVEYRLAPEHKFPAAVDDVYAATLWVAEHAERLGVHPRRLVVAGDSAGGNLAAVVALLSRHRGKPDLAAQVLIYPITDHNFSTHSYQSNAEGFMLTRRAMEWFWSHYLVSPADAMQAYASPLKAAKLTDLPPTLIITAEHDPLRDEGVAYARRLESAGNAVTHLEYEGMIHGFVRRTRFMAKARKCLEDVAGFLKSV